MGVPVKGLGLIVTKPSIPAVAVAIGAPLSALGAVAVYHTFGAVHLVKSGWAKLGLIVGGVLSLGMTLDGMILTFAGIKELAAPTEPDPSTLVKLPSNVAGARMRGLGRFAAQPALLVGQDHWLDREWPDRYEAWWESPGPRL
jgi:hypothetical protein